MRTTRRSHYDAEQRRNRRFGFTLIEVLVSMGLLSFLVMMLASISDSASRAWRDGRARTESFQSARTALEIMARELSPAIVDTRMQFVIAPDSVLTNAKAANVAPGTPVLLWMAPLGEAGKLRCVGYYLYRDGAKRYHRLKRIFIGPEQVDGTASPYYPRMVNLLNPRDPTLRTSPVNAKWFTTSWDKDLFDEETPENSKAAVSTAADSVVAFWIQPLDLLGQPIPWLSKVKVHPRSELIFNSAAYFEVATTNAFEGGQSLLYLAETSNTMKANRVPAAIDITLVTLDRAAIERGVPLPAQSNHFDNATTLNVEESLRELEGKLRVAGLNGARTFTMRVRLVNGM